jgi:hypothetical protein
MTTPLVKQIWSQASDEIAGRIGNNIRNTRKVLIGNPAVNNQIFADTEETQIYVHSQGDTTQGVERISASGIPSEILKAYKRSILIRRSDSGAFVYAGVDTEYDEVYSQGQSTAIDQTPVQLNQLKYGILHRQSGLSLLLDGAMYGDDLVRDLITPDFVSGTVQDTDGNNIVVPTTNRRAIGVLVQLDPPTSTLSYKQSAEYNSSTSLRDAYTNGLLPIRDGDKWRVGYFELIAGATEFTDANVLPLPDFMGIGDLWQNPIDSDIFIGFGRQQIAYQQVISATGDLTVDGEFVVDDSIKIEDGGKLTISDGGQVIIRPFITDQPQLIAQSKEVSADYTVLLSDGNIMGDASGGDITITLPVVATAIGRAFRIGRSNSGGGNVIIDGNGSETINGDLNTTLSSQWSNVIIVAYDTVSVDWSIG